MANPVIPFVPHYPQGTPEYDAQRHIWMMDRQIAELRADLAVVQCYPVKQFIQDQIAGKEKSKERKEFQLWKMTREG